MSLEEEIDQAVDVLRRHAKKFLIMHCNSSYPAHVDELNLRYLETLKKKYDCRIGYSGHEFELITSIVAIVFGAEAIERHITLDRTQWGSDQLASVEPHGLFTLINGLRKVERALGDGKKKLWESEMAVRKKLRG
jgi:N-acetylneuraminate synthase